MEARARHTQQRVDRRHHLHCDAGGLGLFSAGAEFVQYKTFRLTLNLMRFNLFSTPKPWLLAFCCLTLTALATPILAQDKSWQKAFGDVNELLPELREEIVKIPQTVKAANAQPDDKPVDLIGTLFQPPGAGPFPVVVLSHGSPSRGADRILLGRYRVIAQIKSLVG